MFNKLLFTACLIAVSLPTLAHVEINQNHRIHKQDTYQHRVKPHRCSNNIRTNLYAQAYIALLNGNNIKAKKLYRRGNRAANRHHRHNKRRFRTLHY